MNYNYFEKEKEIYFKYLPKKIKKSKPYVKNEKNNPFNILNQINFK